MAIKAWVKSQKDFPISDAPKGISYKTVSSGSNLGHRVEVDYVRVPKLKGIPMHAHKHAETLCVVIAGRGRVEVNGEGYSVRTGDVINIPKGVYHEFRAGDNRFAFISIQSPPIRNDYLFRPKPKTVKNRRAARVGRVTS